LHAHELIHLSHCLITRRLLTQATTC